MPRHLILLTLVAGAAVPLRAQPEPAPAKYWVFFSDRGEEAARHPVPISAQAEARRALRGRPEAAARADLPVSPAYRAALEALAVEVVVESRWLNAVSARLTPEQRAAMAALPFVQGVRPVARLASSAAPSLTPLAPPGGLDYGPSALQLQLVRADRTLEDGYDGEGVRLGYLDTLFDFAHPALVHVSASGRLLGVEDFTGQAQDNYHGLATTSVALGFAEGQLVGPAHAAEVLAATTEYAPTETHAEEDFFVAGLEWLEAGGADVVNVSLGYSEFDPGEGDYTYEDMDGNTTIVTRAVDEAAALGVAVVTSAGNRGNDAWQYITAPADADSVIAVAAVTASGERASFSGLGPTADGRLKPDVAALGVDVYFARPGADYAFGNGTSFSAPMVAGIVCQLLQANPTLNPIEVRDLLRQTASQAAAPDSLLGWGIVDAPAALALALVAEPPADGAPPWRLFPSVVQAGDAAFAEVTATESGPLTLAVYDVLGRRVGTLYDGTLTAGRVRLPLTVPSLPAGAYFVRADGLTPAGVARLTVVR